MSKVSIKSVFIVEPDYQGWIIEKLMRDIAEELGLLDIKIAIGKSEDYAGEDVIFNSRWGAGFYYKQAKINSLFVTHIDDKSKALQLKIESSNYNSLVCMSPHSAIKVRNLIGREDGVIGLNLPPRDLDVRPIKIAYMSRYYPDKRKCEDWIIDYFTSHNPKAKQSFVFSFLGHLWGEFLLKFERLGLNFEFIRYGFEMPGEYTQYKERLIQNDYLIYLGIDGGAMSVYDAIAAGVKVICTDDCYHRDLPSSVVTFKTKADFFAILDRLHEGRLESEQVLQQRSVKNYTQSLLAHWDSLLNPNALSVGNTILEDQSKKVKADDESETFHYFPMTFTRLRSALIRFIHRF